MRRNGGSIVEHLASRPGGAQGIASHIEANVQDAAGGLCRRTPACEDPLIISRPDGAVFQAWSERREGLCAAACSAWRHALRRSECGGDNDEAERRDASFHRNERRGERTEASAQRPDRKPPSCTQVAPAGADRQTRDIFKGPADSHDQPNRTAHANMAERLRAMCPRQTPRRRRSEPRCKCVLTDAPTTADHRRRFSRLPQRTSRPTATAPPDRRFADDPAATAMLIPSRHTEGLWAG